MFNKFTKYFWEIWQDYSKNKLFYILFLIAIGTTIFLRNFHDYLAYVNEWDKIFKGDDPYNAYGVFFHFFSLPNAIYNKLPKLIFIMFYFIAVHNIIKIDREDKLVYRLLLLNPIFWVFGVLFGSNDVFLSSITILAVLNLINNNNITSGFLFSIGINFKYTPLSVLPFLVIDRKTINIKVIITTLISSVIFLSIGFYFWNSELMHGFMYNVNRDSSIFSIFRYISGDYQPLQYFNISSLDFLSVFLVIITWILLFLLFFIYKYDKYLTLLLAYSNILLFYKTGHHQFYLLFLCLTIIVYIIHKKRILENKLLLYSFSLFWIWIFIFTLLYPLSNLYRGSFSQIREWVGLPTFIIHLFLNIQLFLLILKDKRID